MPHYAAFHLSLHCLSNTYFESLVYKGLTDTFNDFPGRAVDNLFKHYESRTRVVNLGTTTKLCLRNFVPKPHIGTRRGSFQAQNGINKGKCHFQFCFTFTTYNKLW